MPAGYRPSRRERFRLRHRRVVLDRLRVLLEPEGMRVLDLGGGTGAPATVFGVGARELVVLEPSERKVARGRAARTPVTFVRGVAESIPYEAARFDRAVSLMSFHHFTDGDLALRETARVLAPGGRVVIYDFNRAGWAGRLCSFFEGTVRGHRGQFMVPEELERRALSAGFRRAHHEPLTSGAFVVAER